MEGMAVLRISSAVKAARVLGRGVSLSAAVPAMVRGATMADVGNVAAMEQAFVPIAREAGGL